jgi:hypothetical protein
MASGKLFGAIRWDFWYSMVGACLSTARNLGNSLYRSRAPFFTTEVSSNNILFAPTQAHMDAEINFAVQGGLSYWAFLLYSRVYQPEGMQGYDLYQSSAIKNNIKWCQIRWTGLWGQTGNFATEVAEAVAMCQQSNYQKVLSGRPLVYVYYDQKELTNRWTNDANFKVALDAFRAACISAGLANPYIVLMWGAGSTKTALGADALSNYNSTIPAVVNPTYGALDTQAQGYWEELRVSGGKVVPICMAGWNKTPRIDRPVPWDSGQRPFFRANMTVTPPTNAELTSHLAAAVAYMNANPSACESNAALIYAWNEFDEGGWLCPTLGDPTGSRLNAIKSTIEF